MLLPWVNAQCTLADGTLAFEAFGGVTRLVLAGGSVLEPPEGYQTREVRRPPWLVAPAHTHVT